MSIRLLPGNALLKTSRWDYSDWDYKFMIGHLLRKRFELATDLIGSKYFNRMLEVGYGSGIFQPTLDLYCQQLYGVDIHGHNENVELILQYNNVHTLLSKASVEDLPFENDYFDGLCVIHSLAFTHNLHRACEEMGRVLTQNGSIVIVGMNNTRLKKLVYNQSFGKKDDLYYEQEEAKIRDVINQYFNVEMYTGNKLNSETYGFFWGMELKKKKRVYVSQTFVEPSLLSLPRVMN